MKTDAILTPRTFEHDHLKARFTCLCARTHVVDFTTREHFDCPCGLRHYPVLRLRVVQQP